MAPCVDANTTAQPLVVFSIKPGLCVLGEEETECRDQLRVKWKSSLAYSLCLYQQSNKNVLRCWQSTTEGEHQFSFAASKTTQFELRETHSQTVLAVKAFKILTDHNTSRHHRRNPWSFF